MKKYLAIAAVAALFGFVSCTQDDPTTPEPISVSPKSVTFEGDGGEQKVAVKSSASTFTATPNADWLTAQVSGKEVILTATNNNTKAERTAKVTIADATSSCELEVIQQIGSAVAGYKPLASMKYEYGGKMMFVNYVNETYGGNAYLTFEDLDGNTLSVWCFTELFASAEEVVLTEGNYTMGKDEMMTYYAVPRTIFPGYYYDYGDDEGYAGGSSFTSNDGTVSFLVDGTMKVEGKVVAIDLFDADGNEYKYAYEGDYELDITAKFSTGKEDPTENIFKVECTDNGTTEAGAAQKCIIFYAGDQENPNMTAVYFNMDPAAEDIAGMYFTPETAEAAGTPGTTELGSILEFGGFTFAMGSAVYYNNGDSWAADGMVSLMLTKLENGNYSVMAVLADALSIVEETSDQGTYYMIMGEYPIEKAASSSDED